MSEAAPLRQKDCSTYRAGGQREEVGTLESTSRWLEEGPHGVETGSEGVALTS